MSAAVAIARLATSLRFRIHRRAQHPRPGSLPRLLGSGIMEKIQSHNAKCIALLMKAKDGCAVEVRRLVVSGAIAAFGAMEHASQDPNGCVPLRAAGHASCGPRDRTQAPPLQVELCPVDTLVAHAPKPVPVRPVLVQTELTSNPAIAGPAEAKQAPAVDPESQDQPTLLELMRHGPDFRVPGCASCSVNECAPAYLCLETASDGNECPSAGSGSASIPARSPLREMGSPARTARTRRRCRHTRRCG